MDRDALEFKLKTAFEQADPDARRALNKDRIKAAARLTYKTLKTAGFAQPRVAVAALNPHGGDGGTCGKGINKQRAGNAQVRPDRSPGAAATSTTSHPSSVSVRTA
jgi:hypothetical protein